MSNSFSAGQQVVANGDINVFMTGVDSPMVLARDGDDLVVDAVVPGGYVVRHLGEPTPFQVTEDQVR